MKTIIAVAAIVAFVVAEPPPSNSYLPPPLSNRGAGYPQPNQAQANLPQVVAARSLKVGRDHATLGHGSATNGIARNNLQVAPGGLGVQVAPGGLGVQRAPGARSAFGVQGANARAQPGIKDQGYENQGYDQNAAALGKNALEVANSEPASYNFGYMVNDFQEGTDFGHHEERQEERAQGEYHVVLPDGRKQTVSYEADEHGFKPQISYEDTEDLARSGYDSNANNFRANNGYQGNDSGYQTHDSGHQGNDSGYQGYDSGHEGHDSGYQGHDSGHQGRDSYHGNEQNGRFQNGGIAIARANGYN